jgi:hypothetical protein
VREKTPKPLKILREKVLPEEIARQYLKYELRKILGESENKAFWQKIDLSIDTLKEKIGEKDFWQLVSGISEGFKLKWVYRVLTNNLYSWRLESITLDDIRMTGMSPFMNRILEKANWKPSKFAKIWKSNPRFYKLPDGQGIKPQPERDHFPILLHEQEGQLKVFDGMRRVCLAALEGNKSLDAWVGRIVNPRGKMMINPDKVLFLRVFYDELPRKDRRVLEAIKTILKAYLKFYRNGREVVGQSLYKWREDPKLKGLANEILAERRQKYGKV